MRLTTGFFLGKKNLTRQCALYPTSMGCFLDGDDIYGKFVVEVDGQYGPYSECNPTNMDVKADGTVGWIDTRNFQCGQGCLDPTVGAVRTIFRVTVACLPA